MNHLSEFFYTSENLLFWMSLEIGLVETKEQDYLGIREVVEVSAIPTKMGELFGELFGFIGKKGIQPVGPPFAYYYSFSPKKIDMECGVPVSKSMGAEGRVQTGKLPSGNALRAVHIGPYDRLEETYNAMMAYAKEMDLDLEETMWECYLTDPESEPDPSKWRTEIFVLVR
jgi:effector-binding domain-containing protein